MWERWHWNKRPYIGSEKNQCLNNLPVAMLTSLHQSSLFIKIKNIILIFKIKMQRNSWKKLNNLKFDYFWHPSVWLWETETTRKISGIRAKFQWEFGIYLSSIVPEINIYSRYKQEGDNLETRNDTITFENNWNTENSRKWDWSFSENK